MKPKDIVKKIPFKRVIPRIPQYVGMVKDSETMEVQLPNNLWRPMLQEDFLSELYPSGHKINLRPPKMITDADKNIIDSQEVAKIAVPLQKIIATKQKIHLATNPIKWTLTERERTNEKELLFTEFKQAWLDKNMHVAISESIGSYNETADVALYFYRNEGKLNWKVFSFHEGDVLFPHYDKYGKLILLGRMYRGANDKGREVTMLDVFDENNVTTYRKDGFLGTTFLEAWKIERQPVAHGFTGVPICYKRNNDVCWGDVQPLIDSFEEALSNMSENNRYYANMILFLKGEITDLPNRDNAGKVLVGKEDADAKFLASTESNASQVNELDILLKQIFLGSFTVAVSPDTVKSSGDLPGITVKLLFSPAVEKALDSAKKWDPFIDRAVELFKEGYGLEVGKVIEYKNLKFRGEIDIYVPENTQEFVRILNDSVFAGSISKQTASEKHPYAVNGEKERVDAERMEENAGALDPLITNTKI